MRLTQGLKIAAEIVVGLYVAFMLYSAVDEIIKGFFNPISQFVPVIFLGILMWTTWRQPQTGFVLVLFGLGFWIPFITGTAHRPNRYIVMITAPLVLAGLLFLLAAWKTPKTTG